jgi:hypothetical protein
MAHIFIPFILIVLYLTYRAFFKDDAKRLYKEGFFIIPFVPKSLRAYTIGYRIIIILGLLFIVYLYIDMIYAIKE